MTDGKRAELLARLDGELAAARERLGRDLKGGLAELKHLYRRCVLAKHSTGAAVALTHQSQAYAAMGNLKVSFELDKRILSLYDRTADPKVRIAALDNVGLSCMVLDRPVQARGYFLKARDLARASGDDRLLILPLRNLGWTYRALGQPEAALGCYDEARAAAGRVGDASRVTLLEMSLGILYNELGRRAEALAHYGTALESYRRSKDRSGEAYVRVNRADTRLAERDVRGAEADHREGLRSALACGERRLVPYFEILAGRIAAARGRQAEAIKRIEGGLNQLADSGERHESAEPQLLLGDLHLAQGRPSRARALWRSALEAISEKTQPALSRTLRARLAALPRA